jgi:hypothetical protein
MNAWLRRALDVGILPAARYTAMQRFFRSCGWHKTEPGQPYPRETPKLFEQLVFHALAEDLITEAKAAEWLNVSLMEFHFTRNLEQTLEPEPAHQ